MRSSRILLIALILFIVGGAATTEVMQATTCTVEADEVVDGTLFAVCRDLTIDGRVNGSVIAAALTVRINGTVADDLYLLARSVDISGTLEDDVHAVAGSIRMLAGSAIHDGALRSIGAAVQVADGVRIDGDVQVAALRMEHHGDAQRDLMFTGISLTVSGRVVRDLYASVGDAREELAPPLGLTLLSVLFGIEPALPGLAIEQGATVGRNVDYIAAAPARIDGSVDGEVSYTLATNSPTIEELVAEESRSDALRQFFGQVVQDIVVLTVLGSIALLVIPRIVQRPARAVGKQVISNTVVGGVSLLLALPITALALIVSVLIVAMFAFIRIDSLTVASLVTFGIVDVGGVAIFLYVAAYIARVIVAAALGTFILERVSAKDLSSRDWMLATAVGATVVALLSALPTIGWMFNLVCIAIGFGTLVRMCVHYLRSSTPRAAAPVRLVLTSGAITLSPQLPPPLVDETPPARGMDNLPEGFRWWDDE